MTDTYEQIKGLNELRDFVLETRRTSAIAIGEKDGRVKSIVECQEALRAIDDAIKDEEHRREKRYPMGFRP